MRVVGRSVLLLHALAWRSAEGQFLTVSRTSPDGAVENKRASECKDLAPGVTMCDELRLPGVSGDVMLLVKTSYTPTHCTVRVEKKSYVRLQYVASIDASSTVGEPGFVFETVSDFTKATTYQIGVKKVIHAWDLALVGMCVGQKATLVVPPEVAFTSYTTMERPSNVPEGATLRYEMEVMIVMEADPRTGKQTPPNLFRIMDFDGSNDLTEDEFTRHFARIGQKVPDGLFMKEDKDGDGRISFDEYGGPKGLGRPPQPGDPSPAEQNAALFKAMDTDSSNDLTLEEFKVYFAKIGRNMPEKLWGMQDKDGDGVVTQIEYQGPIGEPKGSDAASQTPKTEAEVASGGAAEPAPVVGVHTPNRPAASSKKDEL
jgi:Ca2+-binding EF-hand superfamily protein